MKPGVWGRWSNSWPPQPPLLSSFAGSQHSKHASEILRCHRLISWTSCCYQLVHFHFCFWQLSKQKHVILHFPPTKKFPPKKTNSRNHPPANPPTHQAPPPSLRTKKLAGQGVCVHLFGEMHSCDLIPTVGGQFLLRCLYALGGRVELSWENGDVWPFFVGWLESGWKPKLYKSLQKWCFFFKVQVQVRWGLADGTGTLLETN